MDPSGANVEGNFVALVERILPEVYLGIGLLLTFTICLLTPPFYAPDEIAHASREIQICHGGFIGQRTPQGVGGFIDSNVAALMDGMGEIQADLDRRHPPALNRPDGRVTEAQLTPFRQKRWSRRLVFMAFQNTAIYPPILYLPQALGWRVAEIADLTILHSLFLVRLLAATAAIATGWLALRLCCGGRWLLFTYLLLPTVLAQNASCSQDALLLPIAGLAMSLLSRPISDGRLFTLAELSAVTGVLTLCIGARPPYFPLAIAVLLPVLTIRGATWRQFVPSILALVAIAAAVGGWVVLVRPLGTFIQPQAHPDLQIAFLRSHPLLGAQKIVYWSLAQIPLLVAQGVEVLGILDIYPGRATYAFLLVGIAGVVILAPARGLTSRRARWILTLAVVAVCAIISLAEYIAFTPPQADWVACLQGRYYLPLAAVACLLIRRGDRGPADKESQAHEKRRHMGRRGILLLVAMSVFLCGVLYTPWVVARGFYKLDLGPALHASLLR